MACRAAGRRCWSPAQPGPDRADAQADQVPVTALLLAGRGGKVQSAPGDLGAGVRGGSPGDGERA
jgi:hypothetical protein